MTDLNLAKIKEAAEKATPGPWTYCPQHIEEGPSAVRAGSRFGWLITTTASDDDALFIALARTAVPALIARLEAAEARIATAYAEGVEAAAAIHTAEVARLEKQIEENTEYMRRVGRSDHSANNHCHEKLRQHLYYAEAIRSLLKDKPNG